MPADNESVGSDHLAIENMSDSALELGGQDSSDGEGVESEGSMPPNSKEDMDEDGEEFSPQGDSQRPDAWMSGAFMACAKMDRLERKVVPIDVLYSWFVDRRPSENHAEYHGTFSKQDLRYLDSKANFQRCVFIFRQHHELRRFVAIYAF